MSQFEAALFDELEPLYPDTDPGEGTNLYITAVPSGAYAGVHILLSEKDVAVYRKIRRLLLEKASRLS